MDKYRILSIIEDQSNSLDFALEYMNNIYKDINKNSPNGVNAEIAIKRIARVKSELDKLYEELDLTSKDELSR